MSAVETSAWVKIGDCSIEYDVFCDQVEFRFGGSGGFDLVATERGLVSLLSAGTSALDALRARYRTTELSTN